MGIPGAATNVRQQQLAELRQELRAERMSETNSKKTLWSQTYSGKLAELMRMNPDSFSLTKALYLVESAWYDNPPPYAEFEASIKLWASVVKKILSNEGLSSRNNTAINYGIQKLFKQHGLKQAQTGQSQVPIPTVSYDFNDPVGDQYYASMFVTKLLQSGKGQCHSMPLFYLAVAEQLKGKAWLSLSPNHSFIQYFDEKGSRYSFESTNGNLVTQNWLMQCSYINATALKQGTYLDTLSSRQLYAQCMADMLMGYMNKIGHDKLADQITEQILAIDPTNLAALMTRANRLTDKAMQECQRAGNPPPSQLYQYPKAYHAYQAMQAGYRQIEATGFQEMASEVYLRWLQSIEQEKKKDTFRQEQEKMQREIDLLKKQKPRVINKPKE